MPYTTLTLIRYAGLNNKLWALAQMGPTRLLLRSAPGIRFARLLGSGGGNGFSLRPNFSVFAWLGHWESRKDAVQFFHKNVWYQEVTERSVEQMTVHLSATMSHGKWNGSNPFTPDPKAYDPAAPVAVITRATINPWRLREFWSHVPDAANSLDDYPERLLSVGVGEFPVFMQATFSIWANGKAMQDFAYKSRYHREVVKLTRKRGWHTEELFTRFNIIDIDGSWEGFDREGLPEILYSPEAG